VSRADELIQELLDGNPGYDRPAFATTSTPVGIPDNPYKDADKKPTPKSKKLDNGSATRNSS
jgi:hypothetical protein